MAFRDGRIADLRMVFVNLIPQSIVAQQWRKRRIARWTAAVLVAVGALLVPLTLEGWQTARAEQLRARRRALERDRASLSSELNALATESQSVYLQIERANALRSKRSWSGMLALIAGTIPEGCWLTTIETVPAAPASGAASASAAAPAPARTVSEKTAGEVAVETVVTIEAPRQMRIAGYATDASEPLTFVTRLNATGVFARVGLERSLRESVEDGSYFRFDILCEW